MSSGKFTYSVVGIFHRLREKVAKDIEYYDLLSKIPIKVSVKELENQHSEVQSSYVIIWGEKIKIMGKSELSQEDLTVELRKESRRLTRDISVFFDEDIERMDREKRINQEFWREYFTEDGVFEAS